jgi:hypothetical protein
MWCWRKIRHAKIDPKIRDELEQLGEDIISFSFAGKQWPSVRLEYEATQKRRGELALQLRQQR